MIGLGPQLPGAESVRQRAGPGAGEPATRGEGVWGGGGDETGGRERGMEHRDTDGMLQIAT